MSFCRSCGAPIIWARTEAGKAIPLDAEPSLEGNINLVAGVAHVVPQEGRVLFARSGGLYASHFQTCPDARGWRRSKHG